MFPYPSGAGLHVGHFRGYLATDILTRMKMMQGYNVFHPMGFDSFGLPTEQYALKTKKDPRIFTEKNIAHFWKQLQSFGFAYDQKHIIKTHDPHYYQWTQWTFLKLWQHKLAEEKNTEVNFCPQLNTVLANEEIQIQNNQMVSERGNYQVVKKAQKQWIVKITDFAESLLNALPSLNWPDSIKSAQKNWIGKQSGFLIQLPIMGHKTTKMSLFLIDVLELTRGQFILLAINNKKWDGLLSSQVQKQLEKLRQQFEQTPSFQQDYLKKTPLGLKTNLTVKNPCNNTEMPIYFAEYVDNNFGTQTKLGIIEDDIKDWFFASWHHVVNQNILEKAKNQPQSSKTMTKHQLDWKEVIIKNGGSIKKQTFYQMRNWVFARQRYWGEPFPIIHKNKQIYPIAEKDLPLLLPKISQNIFLQKNQLSPLARIADWVNKGYDTNTMPQWAGSCWYFLAYLLKKNDGTFWPLNSPEAKRILNHWMPVDLYVGGKEHAVSHLLYARFWNHFLVKIGCYDKKEPFQKLLNQGLILASDGKKMSKSRGNIVNPEDFLISHGADALRLYEKFLGPFEQKVYWNDHGIDAMRKWLARVFRLFIINKNKFIKQETPNIDYIYHQTVKEVTALYESCTFNVAIAKLMTFINACYKAKQINLVYGKGFLQLLHPICPHLTEEIWSLWDQQNSLVQTPWPIYEVNKLIKSVVIIAVQINGKTKKTMEMTKNAEQNTVVTEAKKSVQKQLQQQKIIKILFVPNKIVNFVLR